MAKLRAPVDGCPWDRRQNFHTIAPYTIEEAYEVADAIERGDMDQLQDELGDLLFQVVFHARMAEEINSFDMTDVIGAIMTKMLRRHPHVFGPTEPGNTGDLESSWEAIKAAERNAAGKTTDSLMDGIAGGITGLQKAAKLQKKAARCGFDWTELPPVVAKLEEEIGELEVAMDRTDEGAKHAVSSELGDVLFSVVNLARHLGLDAETCLAAANHRFEYRFRAMEASQAQGAADLGRLSAAELEQLWCIAKQREAEQKIR